MRNFLPVLLKDAYKIGHPAQYPKFTTKVVSNFTPRGSRVAGIEGAISLGQQYLRDEYFIRQFDENFFDRPREEVMKAYKRRVDNMIGPGTNINHIGELHELGFLPLRMKSIAEGKMVPFKVPVLTLQNTHDKFGWLPNMTETLLSNILWMPMTSATTAFQYRRNFEKYAKLTGADRAFVKWQGHDFSMRGLPGIEAACLSGFGHLTCFTGTDTIPAIDFAEEYYGADSDVELVGGSVPATEHAVMCLGLKAGEWETIDRLLFEIYPTGIVSIVCDTWDFWKVVTEYVPSRRDRILARNGKFVIRPDSGDPVQILTGDRNAQTRHERMGLVACLYESIGGKVNVSGFIELDPHIGDIYGDSITLDRQGEILDRLMNKGFASSNVVLGIGSYTYQYVTRDTFGFAMKATFGRVEGEDRAIWKEPKTDSGIKNSAKGLLRVGREFPDPGPIEGVLYLKENCTWEEEAGGELVTILEDSGVENETTLKEIRANIDAQV